MFSHQQSLRKSLIEEKDSAMALHIILVLLFQQETGTMIHIPGKFIPILISFLGQHVPKKEHEKLAKCQILITAKWKARHLSGGDEGASGGDDGASGGDGAQGNDARETERSSGSEDDEIEALIQELKQLVVRTNS